jgi:hypothetical protein
VKVGIWARTVNQAEAVAKDMGLDPKSVVALGDRSDMKVRGNVLDLLFILPGAGEVLPFSRLMFYALIPATKQATIVDLRSIGR